MINQISVFLENKAGELSEITKILADNNVNLRAISIAETTDYGVLRLIADDAEHAAKVLMKNGNVIEKGSHDELLKKGGCYSELFNSQFPTQN